MSPKSSNPDLIPRWSGAAAYCGLHPVTLKRFEREGQFPTPIRLSPRRVAWPRRELDEWLAARPRGRQKAVAAGRAKGRRLHD